MYTFLQPINHQKIIIMKNKILLVFLLSSVFFSCENNTINTEIENEPEYTVADMNASIVYVQNQLPLFVNALGQLGGDLTRIGYLFGDYTRFDNQDVSGSWFQFGTWSIAYNEIIPNIESALSYATQQNLTNEIGVLKTIKAYVYMTLADFYGKVPYFDESHPQSILYDEAQLYNIVTYDLLDDAISNFSQGGTPLETDLYYDNDFSKWVKLANTLKLTSFLKVGDSNSFQQIINNGNYIIDTADDFEYQYGVSSENPTHPLFKMCYHENGAILYASNWLMNKMLQTNDPRRRYYFYRQNGCAPGNVDNNGAYCPENEYLLACSTYSYPLHYPTDMIFCSVAEGYWGRDHGDRRGIPPDGATRTTMGVYPIGGKFDGNEFSYYKDLSNGAGLGITPILLASWVDFMQAEMALNNNNSTEAENYIAAGLLKSVEKSMTFSQLDSGANANYFPSSSEISDFINSITQDFNNGTIEDKWNILAEQFFITQYSNGILAYNFYRRKGYPTTLQYHLNPNPGAFVRSLLYPTEALQNFPDLEQKPNTQVQVFWDTNPGYPAFPVAN